MGLVLSVASITHGQVRDVRVGWRTAKSKHFAVHYPQPLAKVARRTLAVLETAQTRLAPMLAHTPSRRTHVVITDTAESANGSATPLPFNTIRLFVTAPDDLSPLGDYDDWLTELVVHEHAHILHLDNIGGLPRIINMVIGKQYAPNLAAPRWLIEGIATHAESAETAGGRLRSTTFEMYMRSAVLAGKALSIDQLSNGVDQWPRGNVFYLYGSRFIDYLVQAYGRDTIAKFATLYGRTALPYGLNRTFARITGHTFVELYDQWLAHLRDKYDRQQAALSSQGLQIGQRLTFTGESARAPVFVDDDTVLYYRSDGRSDPQIRQISLSTGKSHKISRVRGTAYPKQRGEKIYFESTDTLRNIYRYYDLFEYKPGDFRPKRLTRGLRARHPDLSPDGTRIIFTQNDTGTRHLVEASLSDIDKTRRILVKSKPYEQVYTPRYSPDGQRVAFSAWKTGGYRDIFVLELKSRVLTRLTHDRALDTGPSWSEDGRYLFFSSDRSGVSNIYRYDWADKQTTQITNVVGGAFHPTVSPDGTTLVYLGYTHKGFDLFSLPLHTHTEKSAQPYVDERPQPSDPDPHYVAHSSRYVAATTLYPRTYTLDLSEDGFGTQAGISIDGQDIVGIHSYSARLGVSLEEGYTEFRARYAYRRSPIPLSASFFRGVAPRGGLVVGDISRVWFAKTTNVTFGASYPLPRLFSSQTLSLSYSVSRIGKRHRFGGVLDPNTSPPRLPNTGYSTEARLGWAYSDVRQHAYDVAPSEGRSLSVGLTFSAPALGNDFRSHRLSWAIRRYVEAPWQQHHVFSFRYAGGVSGSSLGERAVFSVGGFPSVSFVEQLINNSTLGGRALRGYDAFSRIGSQFHLLQTEYRFPIARIQRGPQTVPVYANRVYASGFVDWGNAFFGPLRLDEFAVGLGAELFVDFTVGYYLPYSLRLGIAYGPSAGGGVHYYTHFGVPF